MEILNVILGPMLAMMFLFGIIAWSRYILERAMTGNFKPLIWSGVNIFAVITLFSVMDAAMAQEQKTVYDDIPEPLLLATICSATGQILAEQEHEARWRSLAILLYEDPAYIDMLIRRVVNDLRLGHDTKRIGWAEIVKTGELCSNMIEKAEDITAQPR